MTSSAPPRLLPEGVRLSEPRFQPAEQVYRARRCPDLGTRHPVWRPNARPGWGVTPGVQGRRSGTRERAGRLLSPKSLARTDGRAGMDRPQSTWCGPRPGPPNASTRSPCAHRSACRRRSTVPPPAAEPGGDPVRCGADARSPGHRRGPARGGRRDEGAARDVGSAPASGDGSRAAVRGR